MNLKGSLVHNPSFKMESDITIFNEETIKDKNVKESKFISN